MTYTSLPLSLIATTFLLCACQSVTLNDRVTVTHPLNNKDRVVTRVSPTVVTGSMEAKVGEDIHISLDSNRTTGYQWVWINPTAQQAITLIKQDHVQNSATAGKVGSGGQENFTFRIKTKGLIHLQFEYRRPWEDLSVPAAKTATYQVLVKS